MNVVWGVLVLVAANAVAIATLLALRRRAPEGGYFADSDRASGVFGVLATGFAIFAGFVIFLAFTSYDQSRAGGEAEALTLAQQFETAQFFPEQHRARLSGELVCYGRSVVGQEWPRMEDGTIGDAINPWSLALFRSLKLVDPQTAVEQSAYDKWLDQTSDREEARRDRVHGATGIVPAAVWVVLLITALVVFGYLLFYADSAERVASQAMLIGSATTVVVVTLLSIRALDNPYQPGVGGLRPVAMERSLALVDEARAALDDTAPVPCDANGMPT
jgi:hypothetical protein